MDFDTEEAMEKAIASTLEETPRFGAENPRENRGAGAGWDARERFDYDEKKVSNSYHTERFEKIISQTFVLSPRRIFR